MYLQVEFTSLGTSSLMKQSSLLLLFIPMPAPSFKRNFSYFHKTFSHVTRVLILMILGLILLHLYLLFLLCRILLKIWSKMVQILKTRKKHIMIPCRIKKNPDGTIEWYKSFGSKRFQATVWY